MKETDVFRAAQEEEVKQVTFYRQTEDTCGIGS